MRIITLALVMLAGGMLGGCVKYTKPVSTGQQLTAAQRNFEALWQGSVDALREYGFTIDRQDRRAGIITTKPLVARHWFEPWRHDAVRPYDVLEGTVQTIYRMASVRITPAVAGAENYKVSVEVAVSRSAQVEGAIDSTSEAYNMFVLPGGDEYGHRPRLGYATMGPATPSIDPNGTAASGKDRALAEKLAAEISLAASKRLLEGPK